MSTLPPPLGNLSLWQRTVRLHPLLTANSRTPLPSYADIVIVGGGLMGSVLALELITTTPTSNIILLEARELASGASGRNAGHCRPDAARGFTGFAALHGERAARQILESEAVALERMDALVRENKIDCEWTRRTTYDVCLHQSFVAATEAAIMGLRAAGGRTPGLVRLDGDAAREATRTESALTAYAWPAATVNPAQLTLGVHAAAAAKGKGRYRVFAWAPVTGVEGAEGAWDVVTERGRVRARQVVWATNGYAGAVVPEFDGLVVPERAQAHKLAGAPAGDDAFAPLQGSCSLRRSMTEFYSVTPRPDGTVVLGASRALLPVHEYHNRTDDHSFHAGLAFNALSAWSETYPAGGWRAPSLAALEGASRRTTIIGPAEPDALDDVPWVLDPAPLPGDVGRDTDSDADSGFDAGSDVENGFDPTHGFDAGDGFDYAWTGIIAATPDRVPLIGAVPGKPGQFAAVGFNGHGMARIAVCAPALAEYMKSGSWEESDKAMPACFRITEERMGKLRQMVESEHA